MYFFIVQAVRRRGRPVVAEILTWRPDLAGGYIEGMGNTSQSRSASDSLLFWLLLTIAVCGGFAIARLLWGGSIPQLF